MNLASAKTLLRRSGLARNGADALAPLIASDVTTLENVFTPASGITGGGLFGDGYVSGNEFVIVGMELVKTASAALVVGTPVLLGTFDDAVDVPDTDWGSTQVQGFAQTTDGLTVTPGNFFVNGSGDLKFYPAAAAGAAAGRDFQFGGLRWLVDDPAAAAAAL